LVSIIRTIACLRESVNRDTLNVHDSA